MTFYIRRSEDDSNEEYDDDDDEPRLDFVFDGTIRYATAQASEGRAHIIALRQIVESLLAGGNDVEALDNAIQGLVTRVSKAIEDFEKSGRQQPDFAEFCAKNVRAYTDARDSLLYMHNYVSTEARTHFLTQGMLGLERAVSDVDDLIQEHQ